MWQDPNTGLDYDHARWYDVANGVFISQDPLEFGGGQMNLNEFVGNSPTNVTDPTGMAGTNVVMAPVAPTQPVGYGGGPVRWTGDRRTATIPRRRRRFERLDLRFNRFRGQFDFHLRTTSRTTIWRHTLGAQGWSSGISYEQALQFQLHYYRRGSLTRMVVIRQGSLKPFTRR